MSLDDEAGTEIRKNRSRMVLCCALNLYGPAHAAELVGTRLGEAKVFLQEPSSLSSSVRYCNPHVYSTTTDLHTPFFTKQQSDKDQCFDQEINNILCQKFDYDSDFSFEQDSRVKSLLRPHQVSALKFMLVRESEDWQSLPDTMWKRDTRGTREMSTHKLTKERREKPENECIGGLLADEMGLGKSLSLLALVIHTLEEARRFATPSDTMGVRQLPRIGATLIVTPYSTLRNWQDEILKHIDEDALHLHIHHGPTKSQLHSELGNAQVVLTTYETIAFGRRSTNGHLGQFSWFRVVLDEAQWVRNPSTQVFRALHEFEAQRRWCMTGTPVQNGLNDLCALTRWLRFYPFDKSHSFKKFITGPLLKRDEQGLVNLRHMMRVFQIRRMKADMKLGHITPHTVIVALSNQERNQYEATRVALLEKLAELSPTKSSSSSITVLQGIRELRRMCCDGHALQVPTQNRDAELSTSDLNIECSECGLVVEEHVRRSIFHGQCGHVLCEACYDSSSSGRDGEEDGASVEICCPICGAMEEEATPSGGENALSAPNNCVVGASYLPEPRTGTFVSAKIANVVSKLSELHRKSSEESGKSLVFSYWKNALTSLENELRCRNIPCVRIDGDRSANERAAALNTFRTDPDVAVLLLTFGTGSVGLTLTEATHVHLVEPHWNPMVEEQAIARAHRIGQNRPVNVWRYIVEKSIEESIVRKQQRKLYLAKIAHASEEEQPGKGSGKAARKKQGDEKLEDLLDECHLLQG